MPNKKQIKLKLEKEKEYRLKRNEDLLREQEKINKALQYNNGKLQTLMKGLAI